MADDDVIAEEEEEDDDDDGANMAEEVNGDEDDDDDDEGIMEVDPTQMMLEPQVILQDEDEQEAKSYKSCPVCDTLCPDREHLARHFIAELSEVVACFPDPTSCTQCSFVSPDDTEELAVHIGVEHEQLEQCLKDLALVQAKRNELFAEALSNNSALTVTRQPPPLVLMTQSTGSKGGGNPSSVTCPICDQIMNKSHSRDHIVWHFMDNLRAMIGEDDTTCPQCTYRGEKSENVARHLALSHGQLDIFLQDAELVMDKRTKCLSKPKKVNIGSNCPICDFKDPPREHVSRHFMPELMSHLETLDDQLQCAECNYRGEKPQNLAKHIALVHSMLDELLRNDALVMEKRSEILSKPKKVSIGDNCPICDVAIPKRDSRVHVIWHFMDDLREIVSSFADQKICDFCGYQNPRPDKMAKHLALGHSKLDELLMNDELVQEKRDVALNKPKKMVLGPQCPICDMHFTKNQNRDHVAWHFMDELRELVLAFDDPRRCNQCSYTSDKVDNLVKHIALGHSKLDELMQDEQLVLQKRQLALAKPKKLSLGPECPICDMKFTKNQNRDHVAWHFMDELRELVSTFDDPHACNACSYTSDKVDSLVKHIALGHSKLDELLMDEQLVAMKRDQVLSKMKR